MKVPLQISSRRVSLSEAAAEAIRKKAAKLESFCREIISCRVMVEAPNKRRHHGDVYNIRLDIGVPGQELVVTHEPSEDIYVAIRDAFNAAQRQLKAFSRRRRGEVKTHLEPVPILAAEGEVSLMGFNDERLALAWATPGT